MHMWRYEYTEVLAYNHRYMKSKSFDDKLSEHSYTHHYRFGMQKYTVISKYTYLLASIGASGTPVEEYE